MEMLQPRFISEEEYAEMEEISKEKHEYLDGQVYAMAGGTHRHALISINAAGTLRQNLKGKPCRALGSDQRVKIEKTGLQTYPDASVYCREARFSGKGDQVLLSPVLIVEVLSPATETYDRGDKWFHYQQIPSLLDYLLVTQTHIRVEHFHRHDAQSWLLKTYNALEDTLFLESIDCEISLADLYDGVEISDVLPIHIAAPEIED